jgi:hypothetical protein
MDRDSGELKTTASVGGRRLRLENLIEDITPVQVAPRRVESSIEAGFRMEWLSGEDDELGEVTLTSGAGCGSKWMVMSLKHPQLGSIEEVVDMTEFLQAWAEAAIARGATPVPA